MKAIPFFVCALITIALVGCATMPQSSSGFVESETLYTKPDGVVTRWTSFENPTGAKGQGGMENKGAKGSAMEPFLKDETKVLLDIEGSGIVRRIWMTMQIFPQQARAFKLEMFWDGAVKPAVSVPLADFFGYRFGRLEPFNNALFNNPEGKSMVCLTPMPFKKGARITLTNESGHDAGLFFYDVDLTLHDKPDSEWLYFHAHWRRENPTKLGRDFEILPKVSGSGRFLGCHINVEANPAYTTWWGEGEYKIFLDGDGQWATLVGTGTEDFVSAAWGLQGFQLPYTGVPVCDMDKQQFMLYRYHIPDPVYFDKDCRVTIQQMGGGGKDKVLDMMKAGLPVQPVTHSLPVPESTANLLESDPPVPITDPRLPVNGWVNYYREDDVAATAFFYLDRPENNLPDLAPVAERVVGAPTEYIR